MPGCRCVPLLLAFLYLVFGCAGPSSSSQSLSPDRAAAIEKAVRAFMTVVAYDITQEGPAAWRRHFSDSPAFFMASEGQLIFPNSASASAGIAQLTRIIKHIQLQWGDVRVDPLTPEFAVMAAPYHEIREDTAGKRVDESGYFTAIAEYKNGRWTFRNAHWSVAGPPSAVR